MTKELLTDVFCPECNSDFKIPYIMWGAPTECPSCHLTIIPSVREGTELPITEYHMTFSDFLQLIGEKAYRKKVAPILMDWFGLRIVGEDRDVLLMNDADEAIDRLWLHQKIQSDPKHQKDLCCEAQALWR